MLWCAPKAELWCAPKAELGRAPEAELWCTPKAELWRAPKAELRCHREVLEGFAVIRLPGLVKTSPQFSVRMEYKQKTEFSA